MSICVSRRTSRNVVAIAGLMVGAVTLSGCAALGSRTFGDPVTTGSSAQSTPSNLSQPMPSNLGVPIQVAESRFVPPAYVGGGPGMAQPGYAAPMAPMTPVATGSGVATSVSTQDLPALSSSTTGNSQAMPAQQPLAPVAAQPQTAGLGAPPSNLGTLPVNSSVPQVATSPTSAPAGTFTHTIQSGESLYTVARRYDVTTQAIVQANALSSPDKIVVGQKIIIPGRADLLANRAPTPAPTAAPTEVATASPIVTPVPAQQSTAAVTDASVLNNAAVSAPAQTAAPQPTQVASAPPAEPAMSGSDKFRWPVSGRVITDFAASKGTGINIEVPEGTTVKAAENGTVIYTGSGVEGYGNLVLVRHPNGYVSAYAHLQSISVTKGAVINRGDTIGAAGMTGSVSRPQLHFELRKGATPIDPMPMLAS